MLNYISVIVGRSEFGTFVLFFVRGPVGVLMGAHGRSWTLMDLHESPRNSRRDFVTFRDNPNEFTNAREIP